jgi:succinate dehydrogenase hydrophobic anchor subunit
MVVHVYTGNNAEEEHAWLFLYGTGKIYIFVRFLCVGFRLMHNYRKTTQVIVTAGSVAVFFLLVLILD